MNVERNAGRRTGAAVPGARGHDVALYLLGGDDLLRDLLAGQHQIAIYRRGLVRGGPGRRRDGVWLQREPLAWVWRHDRRLSIPANGATPPHAVKSDVCRLRLGEASPALVDTALH